VVFSLEAQKEVFRSDNFSVDALGQVARAIDSLELSTVNVHVLQNPSGPVDLLAGLINQELRAPAPAGAIIVLGPLSRFTGRIPEGSLEKPAASRFFYVQCRSVPRRIIPVDSGADDMPMGRGRPAAPGAGSQSGSAGSAGSNPSSSAPPPPPQHTNDSSDAGAAPSSGGRGGRRVPPPPDAPAPTGQHDTDVINAAVARLKGRTLVVHTPADLAKAIGVLQRGR
jgi:hypothetical protein